MSREPSLPEKVLAIHGALDRAGIRHAFGGALALGYYAEPRTTIDIDANVFIPPERWRDAAAALSPLGVETDTDETRLEREGTIRWRWGRTPIDLFFSEIPIHEAMPAATRTYDFSGERLPFVGPEHLVAFKALYDRPKDWIDIEQVLAATEGLDPDEVRVWLDRIIGSEDARRERFDRLAREALGE